VQFDPEHASPPEQLGAPPSVPGQHRVPTIPHAQIDGPASFTAHDSPEPQLVPPQQDSFALPHSQNPEDRHVRFAPHVWAAQHSPPCAPQLVHDGPDEV
jgi:hypothetical protein